MEINLKELKEAEFNSYKEEIANNIVDSSDEELASFNLLNWLANLNDLSFPEVKGKNSVVFLSASISNFFTFGYDNIVEEPFFGVFHELYLKIFANINIKYIAIRSTGVYLALYEKDKRVVIVIKSQKSMLKTFFNAHKDKDTVILRPHNYKDIIPGKLKEVPLIKDAKTFNDEFNC